MSYPILYSSAETKFDSNGIGVLSSCLSCMVTEERNGQFELQMKYPVDGIHYDDLVDRAIILAKPNPIDQAQPFRIYRSTKPINGICTFYARHISYDLSGIPVSPFSASNVVEALEKLKTSAAVPCPFTFNTDKITAANMNVKAPASIYYLLAGNAGGVLDVYGGEYKFDRFDVWLYNNRGTDRGVNIRYGKNLLDLEQERNCSNVYTGVYPYWADTEGNLVQLPEKIVNAPGTYDHTRIMTLDLSSEWENAPTADQLRTRAQSYMDQNNIGVPTVSLTVTHAMLEQTEEYKGMSLLERVDLCDTAQIEFPKLGVSASAQAIATVYNVLSELYESIKFGSARTSFVDTIDEQSVELEQSKNKASSLVAEAMKKLNEIVQNSSGLYTTEEVQPDGSTIYYYHDKPNLTESKNVIKFTADAIGLSTDGGKTYPFGFTVTGDMVANILSAIGVNADWINAGILQSMPDENGNRAFYLDLINGILRMKATELTISGQTVDDIAQGKADGALESAKGYADSAVNDFVSAVYYPKIAELQKQLDGQIETHYKDYEPTLNNEPASNWKTEADRQKHEGDLFFWKSKGYAYRFFKDGNTWKWQMVQDTDITAALAQAAAAQDTADGKRTTYLEQPKTPYSEGDLWYRGTDLPVLVCVKSRASGSFSEGDWKKQDNYIDKAAADASANSAVNAQTQDFIFNKLTNNGALQGLFMKDGKLYINASYLVSGILKSPDGETFYLDLENGTLKMKLKSTDFSIEGKTVDEIARDSISIGGTNLLSGTKDFIERLQNGSQYNHYGTTTSTQSSGTPKTNGTYLSLTVLTADNRSQASSVYTDLGAWAVPPATLEPDTDYVLSFYAKGTGSILSYLYPNAVSNSYNIAGDSSSNPNGQITYKLPSSTKWTKYWIVWHTASSFGSGDLLLGAARVSGGSQVSICGVKLEKGNRPTDWSPAPDDGINDQSQEFIFNKLTNNGAIQGLFMQGGQLYINAAYLRGDTIDLNQLRLLGTLCGLMQGYGTTASGQTTRGIVVFGNGRDLYGNAVPPYIIVTDAGIRLQDTANGTNFNMSGGEAEVNGALRVRAAAGKTGGINADGVIHSSTQLYSDGDAVAVGNMYAADFQRTSDRRMKKNIEPLDDAYARAFDKITPVRYRYKTDPDTGPYRLGYIAQDVRAALEAAGIGDAGIVGEYADADGNTHLALSYVEMIAVQHMKINSLESQIKELQEAIDGNTRA